MADGPKVRRVLQLWIAIKWHVRYGPPLGRVGESIHDLTPGKLRKSRAKRGHEARSLYLYVTAPLAWQTRPSRRKPTPGHGDAAPPHSAPRPSTTTTARRPGARTEENSMVETTSHSAFDTWNGREPYQLFPQVLLHSIGGDQVLL